MSITPDPTLRELVWPRPPEAPRYRYVGELTGERNFSDAPGSEPNRTMKVVGWLLGLHRQASKPVVLQRPQGGAVGADGRVYVSDVSRAAVFVFDPSAGELLVWEMATETQRFTAPIGIALGGDGNILVTDAELGIVTRISSSGQPVGVFGGDILQRPTGIARDPERGRIYVADTRANDIKVFDDEGALIDLVGHQGEDPGALNAPIYLAVKEGKLYVTDTLNSRVQVFDEDGNLIRHFGERGLYIGNFARPKGITVGPDGIIYVVESLHDYLLAFDPQGHLLLAIGGTGREPGHFYLPAGTWTDPRGRIYVSDMLNGRVSIFERIVSAGAEP
ncbi:MAG: 6-bladed beta-propeller [Deltaproteobacteria bacterium]|nr:6-bladed beta-propeller [Deltaproteobacteria bacterium]